MRPGQKSEWFDADGNIQSAVVGRFIGQCTDETVKWAVVSLKKLLDLPDDLKVKGGEGEGFRGGPE